MDDRWPRKCSEIVWAVYNWGLLVNVFHRRKYALKYAVENCPSDSQWEDLYEIRKVRVRPIE
jgi:hypothetical protein